MSVQAKTAAQIESMRKGGKILGEILHKVASMVEPGVSTWDLEQEAERLFKQYGVKPGFKGYHGYPAILCTSVNDEVVHTIPNKRPMQKGDIIAIDCGVVLDGLNTDSAIALVVGGETQPKVQEFVNVCIKALWAGIAQVKGGCRVGDIGAAIQAVVEKTDFQIVPELTGHGIGEKLHEPPYVYNYGQAGTGPVLPAGATIAIEPMLVMGSPEIVTLDDDWTIVTEDGSWGIQHEHTILVTENGAAVLTLRPGEKNPLQ